jgi:hypothetical protein
MENANWHRTKAAMAGYGGLIQLIHSTNSTI